MNDKKTCSTLTYLADRKKVAGVFSIMTEPGEIKLSVTSHLDGQKESSRGLLIFQDAGKIKILGGSLYFFFVKSVQSTPTTSTFTPSYATFSEGETILSRGSMAALH